MTSSPIFRQMLKSAGLMTGFIVVGVALLLGTEALTREPIALAERQTLIATFNQVLPEGAYNNDPLTDQKQVLAPELLGTTAPVTLYRARLDGQPAGVIFEAIAPDGYSGNIHLLIGVLPDGRLGGVRTIKHRETPGLGDKIELSKSEWISQFSGHSLREDNVNNWAVKKDGGMFDQFTGATITPRAVVKAIRKALIFTNQEGNRLYD